ncbi:MAG: hypothetical protein WD426_18305 [Anditalea sp.]
MYNLLLEKKFSKQQAEEFVNELDQTVERKFENRKDIFATKSDINSVIVWMVGLVLGQMGLIFLILQLVGVFGK